jgi:nitronate monooxygenase
VLDIARGSPWPAKYPARTLCHPFLDRWRGREDELAAIDLINDLLPAADLVSTLAAQAADAMARAGRR